MKYGIYMYVCVALGGEEEKGKMMIRSEKRGGVQTGEGRRKGR